MSDLINLQGQPWTPGPLHPVVAENDVHVWRVSVDMEANALRQCQYVLNTKEAARADEFRFPQDRARWIAARSLLRVVLGRYLDCAPQEIAFREPPHRKPTLVLGDDVLDLRFNISHSDGVALFAVALGREVGIDVERMRIDFDMEPVAAQVFSDREIAVLKTTSAEDRCRSFFGYWTCKEAYVKTIGAGLSYPMTRFTVEMTDRGRVQVVDDSPEGSPFGPISVTRLSVGPQHCAAIACAGEPGRLRCWHGPAGIPIGHWRPAPDRDRHAA